jgi:hypothetical protein
LNIIFDEIKRHGKKYHASVFMKKKGKDAQVDYDFELVSKKV